MSCTCHTSCPADKPPAGGTLDPRWRRALWIALVVNAAMFVVELVAGGMLPNQGFLKQEEIDLDTFLATHNGSRYADTLP